MRTSKIYGEIWSDLARSGKLIPTNDIWIASLSIQYDIPLVTNDKHFANIDRLKCERWWSREILRDCFLFSLTTTYNKGSGLDESQSDASKTLVGSLGIEPRSSVPETDILSIELWTQRGIKQYVLDFLSQVLVGTEEVRCRFL